MKLKELIKRIEDLPYTEGPIADTITINRDWILESIEQLDEPQKVTIPQFVADWIEHAKFEDYHLLGAMDAIATSGRKNLYEWFREDDNMELFARAWLDGYEIQETRYVVTDGNHLYFKGYQEDVDIVILADEQPGTMDFVKKFDSKEEAQKAADILGWKVQEVE